MQLGATVALIIIMSHTTVASRLPDAVAQALSNRDMALDNTSFGWQRGFAFSQAGLPRDARNRFLAQSLQNAQYEADRQGYTDPKDRRDFVAQSVKDDMIVFDGVHFSATSQWQFRRTPSMISVAGQSDGINNLKIMYNQTYSDGWGAVINTGTNYPGSHTYPPMIWAASGSAAYVNCPFQNQLDVQPEQFAMLMGLDPLKMYGARWELTNSDGSYVHLRSEVDSSNISPVEISLTLDANRGYAPSQIEICNPGKRISISFTALSYRKFSGVWICDKADYEAKQSRNLTKKASWELQTVASTSTLQTDIKPGESVEDYRLLGDGAKASDVLKAVLPGGARPIQYRWPGHLPSLSELNSLRAPLNNVSSASPITVATLATGIALVLCAIWWRLRRR